jgi:tetrapyrrole methylase family protein/MazG family protein
VASPTIIVVGLGPGDERHLTGAARELLSGAEVARLRTRRHPAAASFAEVPSYDELYERAGSFESLYEEIAGDLASLAASSRERRVVYAVPGSPVVAERTVELLLTREDVLVELVPAVSVIDVACCALGRDPMAAGLRVVDALAGSEPLRGPGPLLVLQAYSPAVMALLADRLAPDTAVTVLHHLGLPDERIETTTADAMSRFTDADHLTSVWVEELRTAGAATDDLIDLTSTLRQRCVWDQEQTHATLTRHLLEEAYESIDALERYVATGEIDASEVVEELGDLLFQVAFHAELGREAGRFDFVAVVDGLHAKLVERHPHVFAGVEVADADDAARRWEQLKKNQKGRASVTEGVPLQLPSLTLYAKLRRKAESIGLAGEDGASARQRAIDALSELRVAARAAGDVDEVETDPAWGPLLASLGDLARWNGVDLEASLRRASLALRREIIEHEAQLSSTREP